jgi:hypothetical protein
MAEAQAAPNAPALSLSGIPIPTMDWSAVDLPNAFRKFKDLCELIFDGPMASSAEELKVKYLLIWAGEEGRELKSTWQMNNDDSKRLNTYWTKFHEYVSPKSNFRLARHELREMKQGQAEPIDQFVKRIRILVDQCKYTETDCQILDTIIFGINDSHAKSLLLKKDDKLTVQQAIEIIRIEETTKKQVDKMSTATADVHAVKFKGKNAKKSQNSSSGAKQKSRPRKPKCESCGLFHGEDSTCPAIGTTCDECGKPNHWRPMCKSKKEPSKPKKEDKHKKSRPKSKKVHVLAEDSDEENLYFEALHIGSINSAESEIVTLLKVQSKQKVRRLRCKLATGAQGNAMPLEIYKLLHPNSRCDEFGVPIDLPKPSTRITAYGGHEVITYGTCKLKLYAKGQSSTETFHIVKACDPVIIGYPTCKAMNLVTVHCSLNMKHLPASDNAISGDNSNDQAKELILKDYGDCFDGIGCFQGSYHISLDPEVPPVVHPPRRIPEALREPLKKELSKLVDEGIIAKVDVPTDWVNSIVCATKPRGGLRLCLDPRDLNHAIKRPHHVTPTLDDILPKLNGAKYFTILDARSGYWNIKLDEESSYVTTFNTPVGRFRFLRLPFGLVCAQDVFQKRSMKHLVIYRVSQALLMILLLLATKKMDLIMMLI